MKKKRATSGNLEEEKQTNQQQSCMPKCPFCFAIGIITLGRGECRKCGAFQLEDRMLCDEMDPTGLYRRSGGWAPGFRSQWPAGERDKIEERIKALKVNRDD